MTESIPRMDTAGRSKARSKVAEAVSQRAEMDALIQGWWALLPFFAVIIGLAGLVAFALLVPGPIGLLLAISVMFTLGFAFLAILNYKMTRRLVEHARREALLRRSLADFLRASGEGGGQKGRIVAGVSLIDDLEKEASEQERLPNPAYAAMAALPFVGVLVGYYYLYHINRVQAPHDRRWAMLVQQTSSAFAKLGLTVPAPAPQTMRPRPFIIYLLLSLLFPFLGYWYHVLIKEMNGHIKAQHSIEDQIISALR